MKTMRNATCELALIAVALMVGCSQSPTPISDDAAKKAFMTFGERAAREIPRVLDRTDPPETSKVTVPVSCEVEKKTGTLKFVVTATSKFAIEGFSCDKTATEHWKLSFGFDGKQWRCTGGELLSAFEYANPIGNNADKIMSQLPTEFTGEYSGGELSIAADRVFVVPGESLTALLASVNDDL